MSLLCRIGLHRYTTAQLPNPRPAVAAGITQCSRTGCTYRQHWTAAAPGWVNESVCEDFRCHVDREHPAHTDWQLAAIAEQHRQLATPAQT